jgi:hypothetical protein
MYAEKVEESTAAVATAFRRAHRGGGGYTEAIGKVIVTYRDGPRMRDPPIQA